MKFKDYLAALSVTSSAEEKENVFSRIKEMLSDSESRELYREEVQSSHLIQQLAMAMRENMEWAKRTPVFVADISLIVYFEMQCEIPQDQTVELVESVKEYLKQFPSGSYVRILLHVIRPHSNKLLFLQDEEYFNCIKKAVNSKISGKSASAAIRALVTATDQCVEWQWKILCNHTFILNLLELHTVHNELWDLFGNLVQHPDAKTLLPAKVAEKASTVISQTCFNICAILCSETDASYLRMNGEYIDSQLKELEYLLKMKHVVGRYFRNNLVQLILPFVNLSVADANKEILGKHAITLLLQVVAITRHEPLISNITFCLDRAQQEATKAIWNLAFLEANRMLIKNANGISILETARSQSEDVTVRKNIAGILHMLSDPRQFTATRNESTDHAEGQKESGQHIMISYNWANQLIVKRLAESLKAQGYNVWLDLDQMTGSILEAMADGIEGAAIVLICMSQKYKDSPNCRMEGEYTANRRVPFVPLMMQPGFKPDGWLGIMLGSKLYYEFIDEVEWDKKVAGIVKAIGDKGKADNKPHARTHQQNSNLANGVPTAPTSAPTVTTLKAVKDWTETEILEWLKAEQIEEHHKLFVKHKFDGRALNEMRTIFMESQTKTSCGISIQAPWYQCWRLF